jgi:hypothetical protein
VFLERQEKVSTGHGAKAKLSTGQKAVFQPCMES